MRTTRTLAAASLALYSDKQVAVGPKRCPRHSLWREVRSPRSLLMSDRLHDALRKNSLQFLMTWKTSIK